MKKISATLIVIAIAISSCKDNTPKGKFTLNGELKNAENQQIYLEQLFFNQNNPQVLDTAEIKDGKFTVSATGSEEGLYRLRFEKQEVGYIFINDEPTINFKADVKVMNLAGPTFDTKANNAFKNFLLSVDGKQNNMNVLSAEIDSLQKQKANDSIVKTKIEVLNKAANDFKSFVVKSIDTIADPVVAMFALGYTRGIDPKELQPAVTNLGKRFSTHKGVAGVIAEYNNMMAKKDASPQNATPPVNNSKNGIGAMAPNFTMTDTLGKPFTLSSLKGKYVLVDFWASWCAPCRGENPNVVANYKKYKNKNFTIVGVSLDEDKAAWTKAIVKDKLAWQQVSDLKGWGTAVVQSYAFDAIPYNVLLDPQGKIIATNLREGDLGRKLEEVLR